MIVWVGVGVEVGVVTCPGGCSVLQVVAGTQDPGKCLEVNLHLAAEPGRGGLTSFQNIYFTISLTRRRRRGGGREGGGESESLPR